LFVVLRRCPRSNSGGHVVGNPNIHININNAYGFNDQQPQVRINQDIYASLWMSALWLFVFLPTHPILRKMFAAPLSPSSLKLPV
jgi:hypothetical protein